MDGLTCQKPADVGPKTPSRGECGNECIDDRDARVSACSRLIQARSLRDNAEGVEFGNHVSLRFGIWFVLCHLYQQVGRPHNELRIENGRSNFSIPVGEKKCSASSLEQTATCNRVADKVNGCFLVCHSFGLQRTAGMSIPVCRACWE